MSRQTHSKKAFTLIEVLVVVAIIGILASMGINSYIRALQNGRDARRKSDVDEVSKALQIYWTEHQGTALAAHATTAVDWTVLTSNGYLDVDPTSKKLGGGQDYTYAVWGEAGSQRFMVCEHLELPTGNSNAVAAERTSLTCDPSAAVASAADACWYFCATN